MACCLSEKKTCSTAIARGLNAVLAMGCDERVGILYLPADVHLILAYDWDNAPGMNHILVLLLAEEFIITLHEAMEASAKEVHVL